MLGRFSLAGLMAVALFLATCSGNEADNEAAQKAEQVQMAD
jgi:hypothetical protein